MQEKLDAAAPPRAARWDEPAFPEVTHHETAAPAAQVMPQEWPQQGPMERAPAWRAPQSPGRMMGQGAPEAQTTRPATQGAANIQARESGSRMNTGNGNNTSGAGTGSGAGSVFSHAPPEGHAKKLSEVLGEIVWLMSQSQLHKQFFISDLEWFVMTPVLLQQFRIFYATDRPIGVVLWASVSDEVAGRLAEGTTKLRPQDWKSGGKLWVVEVIAPFGGAEEMVKDLKEKVFPERPIHFLAVKDGKKEVKAI